MIDKGILSFNLNDQISYKQFFGAFGYKPDKKLNLRFIYDPGKASAFKENPTAAELDTAGSEIRRKIARFQAQKRGVFWVVNGGGDSDKEVIAAGGPARAQFMEIDPGAADLERVKAGEITIEDLLAQQIEDLKQFPLEPSIIVRTWKSLHVYWLLIDGKITRFRGLQQQFIAIYGGDSTIQNESRVMRIPGFYHQKHDPVLVKLIKFNPELRYTQDQIQEALSQASYERYRDAIRQQGPGTAPADPTAPAKLPTAATVAADPAEVRPEGELVPVGERHKYVVTRIGEILSRLGDKASDQEILSLIWTDYRMHCAAADQTDPEGFRKSFLKAIADCRAKFAAEQSDPEFWPYAVRAWEAEHPGQRFDKAATSWDEVREAGRRAKDEGKRFDLDIIARGQVAGPGGQSLDLKQFHLFKGGKVSGVYDWAIFDYLRKTEHIFVCGKIPYIYRDGVYRQDISGAEMMTMIRKLIYPQFIKGPTLRRVLELFTGAAELQVTTDGLNQYPPHWINFRNGFYDPLEHRMIPHDPKYRAVNQLPHDYDPDAAPEGPQLRKWLNESMDPEDREMLLQYAGYCMTADTRLQKFMILRGSGGTGKSTVIRMIEAVVGTENLANISLVSLAQHTQAARFSAFGLLGKLVNSCADLEVTALEDTSTVKKILGEDRIAAEAKGKDQVFFKSYAKLIFSTNELPIVKSERTNGFYRRLLVLTMDRVPEFQDPDLFTKLSGEIDAFIHMCVEALERMLIVGTIAESKGSVEGVRQLRNDSDSVEAFLDECCTRDPRGTEKKADIFAKYYAFCQGSERQALTRNNFYKAMRLKHFTEVKTDWRTEKGVLCFRGLTWGKVAGKLPEKLPETAGSGFSTGTDDNVPF